MIVLVALAMLLGTPPEPVTARPAQQRGGAICQAPYLNNPAPDSVLSNLTITFAWGGITDPTCHFTYYDLEIRTVDSPGTGGTLVQRVADINDTSLTLTLGNEWLDTDLYWTVQAAHSSSGATWAPPAHFRITFRAKATITSPTPGSQLGGRSVEFRWGGAVGATGYRLVAGPLDGASNWFNSGDITGTSVTATNLPADGSTVYVRLITIFANTEDLVAVQYTASLTNTIYVQEVWSSDGGANAGIKKSTYYPGDGIKYVAVLNNPNQRADIAALQWSATGPGGTIYSRNETIELSPGQTQRVSAAQTLGSGLTAGTYTFAVIVSHNGQSTTRTWNFTVATGITVDGAWTGDGSDDWSVHKTAFYPGDAIRYTAAVNNHTGAARDMLLRYVVTGPGGTILDGNWNLNTPAGSMWWGLETALPNRPETAGARERQPGPRLTLPRDLAAGSYTFTATVNYNGVLSSKQSTFSVIPVPCPAPALTEPADAAVLSNHQVTFRWSAVTGCTFGGYIFRVKTVSNMEAGGTTIVDVPVATTQKTETFATSLDGQDLWWGVRAANAPDGATWSVRKFKVVTESKASMISPTPGSRLAGVSQTFIWSPGQAAQAYLLWVGPTQGSHGYFGTLWIGDLSVTATDLPVDGSTVWVRLWTGLPSGWQYTDYQYSAALPSQVRPVDVWTNDGGNDWSTRKTVFQPGDPVRYVTDVDNLTGATAPIAFEWRVTGATGTIIYRNGPWTGMTGAGVWRWGLDSSIPVSGPAGGNAPARDTGAVTLSIPRDAAPGNYTFLFTVTHNGLTATRSSVFSIQAGAVTADEVWSSDGGADLNVRKTVFGPGQSIRYVAAIRNLSGGPVTVRYQWDVRGPGGVIFALDEPAVTAPGGLFQKGTDTQTLAANLTPGTYTLTFTMTYNGTPVTRTAQFTVGSPPATPSPPTVTPGATSITLNWAAVSGATGYRIAYTRSSPISYQFVDVTGTTWTLPNAVPGEVWYFHLAACNASGCSQLSDAVAGTAGTTPPVPSNFRVGTTVLGSIQVLWNDVSGESQYQIAWTATSPINYQFVNVAADATNWTHSGLPSGQSNYYHIRACNGVNCSAWSDGVGATASPFPAMPSGLQSGAVTNTSIEIRWNDVTSETRYLIAWTASAPISYQFPEVTGNTTTWTATSLTTGGIYYFHVAACAGLNCSGWSPGIAVEARTPPATPTGLRAGLIHASTIELLWNDVSGETSYRIAWTRTSPLSYQIVSTGANVTSTRLNGMSPAQSFYIYVQACAGTSCSAWSNEILVSTRATSDWIVELRWGANAIDLDSHLWLPPASAYHVFYVQRGSLTSFPNAALAQDAANGIDPEITTITTLYSGTYTFAVNNYSSGNAGRLAGSGTVVNLYQGSTLRRTYTVPASGTDTWWDVFRLDSAGAITDVNTLSGTSPAPYRGDEPPAAKPAPVAAAASTGGRPDRPAGTAPPPPAREVVIPTPPLTPSEVVRGGDRRESLPPAPPATAPPPGDRPPSTPPPPR